MNKLYTAADYLWGQRARVSFLMLATFVLLFTLLGARDIWTQEHRWADIVSGMFYRNDFLHPFLGENNYYDKPLLSYWLIVIAAKMLGGLSAAVLRIPSALAGMLAVWSIVRLGEVLKDRSLGLLSGWLLLTTFYFVFWARTSSADMLNLAGSLFAVTWYFIKREQAGFFDFAIFFLIVALTSLCKGLVGAIVPALAVMTDIVIRGSIRQYLRWPVFAALLPALVIYVAPFIASSYYSVDTYHQNGLYLVYRENILRYFKPFDHQGPIYTYFLYLPIYMFPWALLFIPAILTVPRRWSRMTLSSKWMVCVVACLFLFFTLSGSRRSYYVLPIVPFAILMTADWLLTTSLATRLRAWSSAALISVFALLLIVVDVVPAWYYAETGVNRFASELKGQAEKIRPWQEWRIELLDAESKLNFYLQLPPNTPNLQIKGVSRKAQTEQSLVAAWPILNSKPDKTIFITRLRYANMLKPYFADYDVVTLTSSLFKQKTDDAPIAFVPRG